MEHVLNNESRIPARITFLKPVSAAVAIGTGGPFGAKGPVIATGSALGSLMGQTIPATTLERKTLLAAGAAAGMAATFGSPVASVLLAVELLLFEYRPRSIIPVALASSVAAGARVMFEGMEPAFAMPQLAQPSGSALAVYVVLGGLMGFAAALVTRILYGIEDAFEKLPIHWMWWPAIGAIAVGIVEYLVPDTLGVGYHNSGSVLSGGMPVNAMLILAGAKFVSWSFSLGSGTSGGSMAPLFTVGGALGGVFGMVLASIVPGLGVDVSVAALVGIGRPARRSQSGSCRRRLSHRR